MTFMPFILIYLFFWGGLFFNLRDKMDHPKAALFIMSRAWDRERGNHEQENLFHHFPAANGWCVHQTPLDHLLGRKGRRVHSEHGLSGESTKPIMCQATYPIDATDTRNYTCSRRSSTFVRSTTTMECANPQATLQS